jgi:hypothetical protein
MKAKQLLLTTLALCGVLATLSAPAHATDVGVSVSIGQPGFYGRIDIGGYPQPALIYRQPMIIAPVQAYGPPVYLRVPPGHAKNWGKHCHKYGACSERVYFVQDNWYEQVYVPGYQERHEYRRGNDRYDDDRHDGHRGRGEEKGRGHGKGHGHGHDR